MSKGIDYAFGVHPPAAAVKAAGFGFVCRYMSDIAVNDTNGKNLLPGELKTLLGAGLEVVVVEESTAGRMRSGHAAGVADAQHGQAVTKALGMATVPVYFACDFDATPGDQTAINAYLDGAASVIGRARTGIYGGYYPVKRALDAGKATWAWQTSAWSGGQWDSRAHIRQHGSVSVGGVTVDFDEAMAADFGQWPRPAAAASAQTVVQVEYYKDGFGWVLPPGGTLHVPATEKVRVRTGRAAVSGGTTAVPGSWSAWRESGA